MIHFTGVIVRSRCVIQSADRLSVLATKEFGEPLHLLVIPGEVHHIEADCERGLHTITAAGSVRSQCWILANRRPWEIECFFEVVFFASK